MWRSLIVVDVTEYHRFPSIYFTTVPRRFNISTYKMRLIENNVPHNWEIFSVSKSIPFVSKEIGPINVDTNYSVELAIGDDDGFSANCYKSSSSVFSFYIEPGWYSPMLVQRSDIG